MSPLRVSFNFGPNLQVTDEIFLALALISGLSRQSDARSSATRPQKLLMLYFFSTSSVTVFHSIVVFNGEPHALVDWASSLASSSSWRFALPLRSKTADEKGCCQDQIPHDQNSRYEACGEGPW